MQEQPPPQQPQQPHTPKTAHPAAAAKKNNATKQLIRK
jgi:hypothetical protein